MTVGVMGISVQVYIDDAVKAVQDVHKRHIPFASVYAATLTAREVKLDEIRTMREVFDRPTPYALNALAVIPATMSAPVATVEFDIRDPGKGGTPAKRFLNPNIHGGRRSQKSHERLLAAMMGSTYLMPAKGTPINAYGNVSGATFKRIISQLKVSSDPMQNATGSYRSKRKRRNDAYFKVKGRPLIMHRKGDVVSPVLVGVRAPHYQKRFPFYEVAQATVAREFPRQFVIALERAIAKGNSRGKW